MKDRRLFRKKGRRGLRGWKLPTDLNQPKSFELFYVMGDSWTNSLWRVSEERSVRMRFWWEITWWDRVFKELMSLNFRIWFSLGSDCIAAERISWLDAKQSDSGRLQELLLCVGIKWTNKRSAIKCYERKNYLKICLWIISLSILTEI